MFSLLTAGVNPLKWVKYGIWIALVLLALFTVNKVLNFFQQVGELREQNVQLQANVATLDLQKKQLTVTNEELHATVKSLMNSSAFTFELLEKQAQQGQKVHERVANRKTGVDKRVKQIERDVADNKIDKNKAEHAISLAYAHEMELGHCDMLQPSQLTDRCKNLIQQDGSTVPEPTTIDPPTASAEPLNDEVVTPNEVPPITASYFDVETQPHELQSL